MLHRLVPRRPSRLPQLIALAAAAVAAAILVLYGPPVHGAGVVQVRFVEPARYADVAFAPAERERLLDVLAGHFRALGAQLPDGQTLRIDVLDVDLAGQSFPRGANERRTVAGGADWPRLQLRWTLLEGERTLKSGEERLADMDYLMTRRPADGSDSNLPYERRMIENWFAERLAPPRP